MPADANSPVDLSEMLTRVGRDHLSSALSRQVQFFFDYEGDWPQTEAADAALVQRVAYYLVGRAIDAARQGSVFFSVQGDRCAPDRLRLQLQVAAAGAGLQADSSFSALAAPGQAPQGPAEIDGLWQVREACDALQGHLQVDRLPGEGLLLRADFHLDCQPGNGPHEPRDPPDARGAEAWLIGQPPVVYESLARRLQRLGWHVRVLGTVDDACDALNAPQRQQAPALALGCPMFGVTAADFARLRRHLGPGTAMVFSPLQEDTDAAAAMPGDVLTLPPPLSPGQLVGLTRHAARPAAPAPQERSGSGSAESRPRLLVADDNEVNQHLFCEMLKVLGYEVEVVDDGQAAVDRCQACPPDGVLMDVMMPRLSGLDATRELRRRQAAGQLQHFPIIAATALVTEADQQACRDAGMDAYLSKPMDLAALAREVHRHVPLPGRESTCSPPASV